MFCTYLLTKQGSKLKCLFFICYAQKDAYSSKTKKYVGCSVIPAPTIYQIYAQKKEYKKDCIPSHFIALIGLPDLTESQQY